MLGHLQWPCSFPLGTPRRCSPLLSGVVVSFHLCWASAGLRGELRPELPSSSPASFTASREEPGLFSREVELGWSSCSLVVPARLQLPISTCPSSCGFPSPAAGAVALSGPCPAPVPPSPAAFCAAAPAGTGGDSSCQPQHRGWGWVVVLSREEG